MSWWLFPVALAQISLCLAAFWANPWVGCGAVVVAIGTVWRVHEAIEAEVALGPGPAVAVMVSSMAVTGVITGAGGVGFVVPWMAFSLICWGVDGVCGFTHLPRDHPAGTGFALVILALMIATLGISIWSSFQAMAAVYRKLWPIASTWRERCHVPIGLATEGLLLGFVITGIAAWGEGLELNRRIDRVAERGRLARVDQRTHLDCIVHIQDGPARCSLCQRSSLADLTLAAHQADLAARGEEEWASALQAGWRESWKSWLIPGWAVALAALGLVILAARSCEWPTFFPKITDASPKGGYSDKSKGDSIQGQSLDSI